MDFIFLDALSKEGLISVASLGDLAAKGGPAMIPILICLVAGCYIFAERYFVFNSALRVDKNFMPDIRDFIMNDNIPAAKALCKQNNSPIARMIEKGLDRIGKPVRDIESSMENSGKMELFKLEKGIGTLATIAAIAPMLGFLGTMGNMVRAFPHIENSSSLSAGLPGGIYESLVPAMAGLAVGIPTLIGYNWIVGLIKKIVNKMEANSIEFIELLQEPVIK